MRSSGLTLIELLLTIAVAAILLGAAIPSFSSLLARSALSTARDDLIHSLNLARTAAIMRGTATSVCAADANRECAPSNKWEYGWLVFEDPDRDEHCADVDGDGLCDADGGQVLAHVVRTDTRITIRGNHFVGSGLSFDPLGHARWSHGTFSICDSRRVSPPGGIVIAPSGRIRSSVPTDSLSCP